MRRKLSQIVKYTGITLVLGILFLCIAVWVVNLNDYHNSDFFTFWLSGRLALTGQNPYLAENWIGSHHLYGATWIPNSSLVYPLPLSILFIPLGLIPIYEAFVLWVGLSQILILLSILLLFHHYPSQQVKQYAFPLAAGVILFRPTLITLINGQLSGLLLFLLVLIVFFWEQEKWWQGSAFIPLLALKPNLGVPIIFLLFFYLIIKKKKTSLIVIFTGGIILILLGMILDPEWIVHYWFAGNAKMTQTFGYVPSIWGLNRWLCDGKMSCIIGVGSGMTTSLLGAFAGFIIKNNRTVTPKYVVCLSIVIMLLLTPHTWPYDQLLLIIPIIVITLGLAKTKARFLPTAIIFLLLDILALIILKVNAFLQNEIWSIIITIIVFLLLLWYQKYEREFVYSRETSKIID
jgi:hypothetical protein